MHCRRWDAGRVIAMWCEPSRAKAMQGPRKQEAGVEAREGQFLVIGCGILVNRPQKKTLGETRYGQFLPLPPSSPPPVPSSNNPEATSHGIKMSGAGAVQIEFDDEPLPKCTDTHIKHRR